MRILVVPSGFKESLGAKEGADVMKEGILKVMPLATVETLPMVDGGEGFTEAIINITGGKMYNVQVTGPVGDEIQSYFGIFETRNGERTAVIEMALQKVQGEIKHTILEKRNEIEVFVITVETNDKQSKVVEIEKTTGQIQLLEKPMTKITEEQAKEIAVQISARECKEN